MEKSEQRAKLLAQYEAKLAELNQLKATNQEAFTAKLLANLDQFNALGEQLKKPKKGKETAKTEDIGKTQLYQILNDGWATAQRTILSSYKDKKFLILTKDIKAKFAGTPSFKIVEDLQTNLLATVSGDPILVGDLAKAFDNAISNTIPKTEEGLKDLFKADKKDYTKASEEIFRQALNNLQPAQWLKEETDKTIAPEKIAELANTFFVRLSNGLAPYKIDSFFVPIAETHKKWESLLKNGGVVFDKLLVTIQALPNPCPVEDFVTAVENCKNAYYSTEQIVSVALSQYNKASFWVELKADDIVGTIGSQNYNWDNQFTNWLNNWKSENTVLIDAADTSLTEVELDKVKTNLNNKLNAIKESQPLLWYIGSKWQAGLTTNKTVSLHAALKKCIQDLPSDTSQSPLTEQLALFKKGTKKLPSVDTFLNCLHHINIRPEDYIKPFKDWATENIKGVILASKRSKFTTSKLLERIPSCFDSNLQGQTAILFIGETFRKNLSPFSSKQEISVSELDIIWQQTLQQALGNDVLQANFAKLQETFKDNSKGLKNLIADISVHLPAPPALLFGLLGSAIFEPVIIKSPEQAKNNPAAKNVSILFSLNKGSEKACEAQLDLGLDYDYSSKLNWNGQATPFMKVASANARLLSVMGMGGGITLTIDTANIKFSTFQKASKLDTTTNGQQIEEIKIPFILTIPSITITKKSGTGWQAALGTLSTVLTTGGGAATGVGLAPGGGWLLGAGGLVLSGLGYLTSKWADSMVEEETKILPAQTIYFSLTMKLKSMYTPLVPGIQLNLQPLSDYDNKIVDDDALEPQMANILQGKSSGLWGTMVFNEVMPK